MRQCKREVCGLDESDSRHLSIFVTVSHIVSRPDLSPQISISSSSCSHSHPHAVLCSIQCIGVVFPPLLMYTFQRRFHFVLQW